VLAVVVMALAAPRTSAFAAVPVVRVSVSSGGGGGNGASYVAAVSPDGRFVVFTSASGNLVSGDTNGVRDVFLRDRVAGRTVRVSVGPGGRQGNAASWGAAVSGDGRFVLFMSSATNLTRLADTNNEADVFVRDRRTGSTFRVSVPPGGGQFHDGRFGALTAGGISDDGRFVTFGEYIPFSAGGCCVDVVTYLRDRSTGETRQIAGGVVGSSGAVPVGLSASGQYVLLERLDLNFNPTALVLHDRLTGHNTPVGGSDHLQSRGIMTADAHYVVFSVLDQHGTGWNVIRWNRVTGVATPVIENNGFENVATGVSTDGRYVAFDSPDPSLVAGDTNTKPDVFRRDLATNTLIRVDLNSAGAQIGDGANNGLLTEDGSSVIFDSLGRAVPNDGNSVVDVFLRGPLP
jgi:Tol biopolymer transport system component